MCLRDLSVNGLKRVSPAYCCHLPQNIKFSAHNIFKHQPVLIWFIWFLIMVVLGWFTFLALIQTLYLDPDNVKLELEKVKLISCFSVDPVIGKANSHTLVFLIM